jgi:hypothetical protein
MNEFPLSVLIFLMIAMMDSSASTNIPYARTTSAQAGPTIAMRKAEKQGFSI